MVILAFEPVAEAMSNYFGSSALLKCAEGDPSLAAPLSANKKKALAGAFLPVLQERFSIAMSGMLPDPGDVYALSSFDGDANMVYPRPRNTMALGFDPGEPVDLAALTVQDSFALQVNLFIADARKIGASVYLSFCPVNRSALADVSEAALQAWYDLMTEQFSCPCISDPSRYILESSWFYDSNFHLNTAGSRLRTLYLAEDLLAELGCYKTLTTPYPSMPAVTAAASDATEALGKETGGVPAEQAGEMPTAQAAREPEEQADGMTVAQAWGTPGEETAGTWEGEVAGIEDEACFAYTPITGETGNTVGWCVTGLTEEGMIRTALTVPAMHEGLPVLLLGENALQGMQPDVASPLHPEPVEGCTAAEEYPEPHPEPVEGCTAAEEYPSRSSEYLEELTIPASVTSLPDNLFNGTLTLKRLILLHTGKPCSINRHTFDGADSLRVFVPESAYHYYRDGYGCEENLWEGELWRVIPLKE